MSRKSDQRSRGYAAIGLWMPKTSSNVGSVLRAAFCFEAAMVVIQGPRYRRASTDTPAAFRHLPLLHVDDLMAAVPFDCVPVGIEVGGKHTLSSYVHPERAFYVFGPEDGSIPDSVRYRCRDIVQIDAGCLNLAMAAAVVLYDRTAKRSAA